MTRSPRLEGRWDGANSTPEVPANFTISLRNRGYFEGTFFNINNELSLSTVDFRVTSEHSKGTGTRLMKGALALARDCGASETGAWIESPAALYVRKKLFGSAIAFYGVNENDPEIHISVEEAIAALDGKGEFAQLEPFSGEGAVIARSDLTTLDTSGWERPVMLNRPPAEMRLALEQRGITPPPSLSQIRQNRRA